MYLHEFLLYMVGAIAIVYGAMFCIEWFVQKQYRVMQSVVSTSLIYVILLGIGVVTNFHIFILYSFLASAVILLNRYWIGYYTVKHA